MTEVQKFSAEYIKLTSKLPISDVEYALKYAIALLTGSPKNSVDVFMTGVKSDVTITALQKKLMRVLLHYKASVLKKLLARTTKALNATPRDANIADTSHMDPVNKKLADAMKYLFREELQFCLRFALFYKHGKNFNLKADCASIKKNPILKHTLKKAINAMLLFRTLDLEFMLKKM